MDQLRLLTGYSMIRGYTHQQYIDFFNPARYCGLESLSILCHIVACRIAALHTKCQDMLRANLPATTQAIETYHNQDLNGPLIGYFPPSNVYPFQSGKIEASPIHSS